MKGVPFVVIGHTETCAWGITLSFCVTSQLHVEKVKMKKGEPRYFYNGKWRKMKSEENIYNIKGEKNPQVEKVYFTKNGVIISKLLKNEEKMMKDGTPNLEFPEISFRATFLEPSNAFDGFAMLNHTRNFKEFLEYGRSISGPSLNITYADTHGDIGYVLTGRGISSLTFQLEIIYI